VFFFFVFSYDTMIYHLLRICSFETLGQTRTASKVHTTRKDCHRSEMFLDCKVYLDLWVKVQKDWRDNQRFINNLGYNERDL
jgi:hypothetical protein